MKGFRAAAALAALAAAMTMGVWALTAGAGAEDAGPAAAETAETAAAASSAVLYTVREQGGAICVFRGGTLLRDTGIPVSTLPAPDRALLEQGIAAADYEGVLRLLEDLGS